MRCYRANPQVMHETIEGETIIIDLSTGTYFSLRGSAPAIWSDVGDGASLETVVRRMAARYDAPPDELAVVVETFLERLEAEQLIEPGTPPAVPPTETESPRDRLPFEAPELERYEDLQDIILLDPVHKVDDRGWPHTAPVNG